MAKIIQPGTILSGRYHIEAVLGQGGMGVVYRATDRNLGRSVALKIIQPHRSGDSKFAQRFEQEAKLVAKLNHPNIMRVFDFNQEGELYYMVAQFVEGETLYSQLERLHTTGQRLSLTEIVMIAATICDSLAHAHAHGIIHRDIKPANIMLAPDKQVILMDFGLAKILGGPANLTMGGIVGTPHYMAPEQAQGQEVDARTDIYALGVILFEMVTAQRPFDANESLAILLKHVQDPIPDIQTLAPDTPAALVTVIEKALAKDPSARFPTATDMATALHIFTPAASPYFNSEQQSEADTKFAATHAATLPQARPIRYEAQFWQQELQRLLDDFIELFQGDRAQQTVGREFVGQFRARDKNIRHRLETEFSLVVLGDFKRGKSTLINALVGAPVVTTDVLPETVTINHLRYGPAPKVEAHLPDGGCIPLTMAEIRSERLTKILEGLPQPPEYLQIETPTRWLQGVQLVDTPGLSDIFHRFDNQVRAYLPRADAVVYVISALAPLAESERTFLQHSLRPHDFPKILFVVNMLDSLTTEKDSQRVLDLIKAKLHRLFPDAPVFGISALDEFCRLQGQPAPRPDRAAAFQVAFKALRDHLADSILFNRDLLQVNRAAALTDQMLQDCATNLGRLQAALESDRDRLMAAIAQCEDQDSELHQRIKTHKQRIRHQIETLAEETVGWMAGFMQRLHAQVITNITRHSHEDIQKHFPFFLADTLQAALRQCLDAHQTQILDTLSLETAILADLRRGPIPSVELDRAMSQVAFDPGGWTFLDNLNLVLIFTGLGPLGTLLAGLANKKLGTGEKVSRYQDQLNRAMPELQQSISAEIRALYRQIADMVEGQLEAAYHQHLEASLATLRQARELQDQGRQQSAAFQETLRDLLEHTERIQSALADFQGRLQAAELATVIVPNESVEAGGERSP